MISYISGLLLIAISAISCSDDFLSSNNRVVYYLTDTLFVTSAQDNVVASVPLGVNVNSAYTIRIQPKWLSFSSMHGKVTDGSASFSFSIVKEYIPPLNQTQYSSILLELENGELLMLNVTFTNFGSPLLKCSVSSLNFESSDAQIFTISNTYSGILNWEISGVPYWLIISKTSGSLNNDNPVTISASLNLDNLPRGQDLSAILQINSNSISGNITIPVHVSAVAAAATIKIEGIVTDSEFNHETGIMAICTKTPNSLIIFNTYTSEYHTISLSKTPNCISLSGDGHKAVIGYSVADISYFDIDRLEITAEYSIDCMPYDIVLNDNGWCYITPVANSWDYLRNIDLNSGELIPGLNTTMIYGRTIIRKIHGKPYLVGTRPDHSPTGLLIFDVTDGSASDTIAYYHADLGDCWASTDGARLYTRSKKVYTLPEYNGQYNFTLPDVYGIIASDFLNISGLDECPAINSIFIFSSYFDYSYEFAARIEQYNSINFNKTNTFQLAPVTVSENGTTLVYQTSPGYIFVNKEGSTLYAIKNLNENSHKDYWTIESIKLNNSGK